MKTNIHEHQQGWGASQTPAEWVTFEIYGPKKMSLHMEGRILHTKDETNWLG